MRALWSDRQNCSHKVSQKVKRIRRLSDLCLEPEEVTELIRVRATAVSAMEIYPN